MVHLVFIVIGLDIMSSSSIHDNHTRTFIGVPLWFFFFFFSTPLLEELLWLKVPPTGFCPLKSLTFPHVLRGHTHTLRSQAWRWIFSTQQLFSFFFLTCLTLACPVGPEFLLTKLSSWPWRAKLINFPQICSVRSCSLPLFPVLCGICVIPLLSAIGNKSYALICKQKTSLHIDNFTPILDFICRCFRQLTE